MHPLGARTREDMKERIMDRTQYTNLAKAWEFTEEHARERESDALTDTRTAADESGQLQGSAAQAPARWWRPCSSPMRWITRAC